MSELIACHHKVTLDIAKRDVCTIEVVNRDTANILEVNVCENGKEVSLENATLITITYSNDTVEEMQISEDFKTASVRINANCLKRGINFAKVCIYSGDNGLITAEMLIINCKQTVGSDNPSVPDPDMPKLKEMIEDAVAQAGGGAGLAPLVGTNKTLTPTQVKEAFLQGQPIVFSFIDASGEVAAIFQSFELSGDIIVASAIIPIMDSKNMGVGVLAGRLSSNAWNLSETVITNPDDIQTAINTALAAAKASGEFDGADGITPTIGNNGNWFLGDTDTGKPSRGEKGDNGAQGIQGEKGDTGADGATGADGKSAYSYAQEGGYTGTEAEFAAKLAAEGLDKALYVVNITMNSDGTLSADKTFEEIKQVYDEGKYSIVAVLDAGNGENGIMPPLEIIDYGAIFGIILNLQGGRTVISMVVAIAPNNSIQMIQTPLATEASKLPNPYPLTFTGAVNATYDGSSAKTIAIPSGGGGLGNFELIGTVDFSQEGMAAASAGVNFEVSDVSEIVLVYNDLVNSTSSNSFVNVYLNKSSKRIESGLHPNSGKSGTPLNGRVFIKLLPGVGLTGIQNDGNASATNYSLGYAKTPYNIIPLASDFRITEIYIQNPPTQYYAVGGTVKVYVR